MDIGGFELYGGLFVLPYPTVEAAQAVEQRMKTARVDEMKKNGV